jgi:signal transduction histidine kinase
MRAANLGYADAEHPVGDESADRPVSVSLTAGAVAALLAAAAGVVLVLLVLLAMFARKARDRAERLAAIAQRIAVLERERAEQERRFAVATAEMESFSYSVSHDLRSPLRVVDGFAGILLEDYGPRLDELGRDHVRRIRSAAARMNAMIEALLALSRRTGHALDVESVDMSRLARELADELRAGDLARKVQVRIGPDIRARGDPVLLRLVLQNLLGNAIKFSARVPNALVEFERRRIESDSGGDGAGEGAGEEVYLVRDNGAGFDMRYAERLFGLFQRFHSPQEFPGTGVGLATVQRIVRRHGGRVWAESEPGKGATFYFTLGAQAHSAASPPAPLPQAGEGRHIA